MVSRMKTQDDSKVLGPNDGSIEFQFAQSERLKEKVGGGAGSQQVQFWTG